MVFRPEYEAEEIPVNPVIPTPKPRPEPDPEPEVEIFEEEVPLADEPVVEIPEEELEYEIDLPDVDEEETEEQA